MISDLCNFYHILMENISFDKSIFKTVPVSYLTAADKGPYDNQHNIEDFKRVLGEVQEITRHSHFLPQHQVPADTHRPFCTVKSKDKGGDDMNEKE
ncbi:hypothetical protein G6F42_027113 [Rhizopus arrhizus]|nr:hypothetical protein G6F42_027113 [Rhizopus arrhizus]